MRLKDNHSWNAPEGYKIVVLDRGAVSFNIPQKWIVANHDPFELHDGEPPDDNARVSVTFWRFPPDVDWSGLPLGPTLEESLRGAGTNSEIERLEEYPLVEGDRTDLEIVWKEHRFIDPVEKREAFSRTAFARGFGIHVVITLDYWKDDAENMRPIWDEVLRSLHLGRTIEDPTKGVTLQ